jgi:hypothetical protein
MLRFSGTRRNPASDRFVWQVNGRDSAGAGSAEGLPAAKFRAMD